MCLSACVSRVVRLYNIGRAPGRNGCKAFVRQVVHMFEADRVSV